MRVCILCEESKVTQAREKTKRDNILTIPCSETGELPATHRFCCIATDERGAQELLSKAEITTMEISGPKEFLTKWNLKIIK
jgi:hypothetical protein